MSKIKRAIKWNELSTDIQNRFLMGGKAKFEDDFYDNYYDTVVDGNIGVKENGAWGQAWVDKYWKNEFKAPFYSKEELNQLADIYKTYAEIRVRDFKSNVDLKNVFDKYPIKGKDVVIFGSTTPKYEALCLAFGGKPTTIEYQKIVTDHPDLKTMTVEEYEKTSPQLQFDVGFSFSSHEHDGLGRYNDPINPDGDLESLQKTRHIIKKDGILFLAVPRGEDKVVFNSYREYGVHRWPMLIEKWEELEVYSGPAGHGNYEPISVLKNNDYEKPEVWWNK